MLDLWLDKLSEESYSRDDRRQQMFKILKLANDLNLAPIVNKAVEYLLFFSILRWKTHLSVIMSVVRFIVLFHIKRKRRLIRLETE